MKVFDYSLEIAGRLVGARFPDRRDEILMTARDAGRERGGMAQVAELASLVALALPAAGGSRSARVVWLHGSLLATLLAALSLVAPAMSLLIVAPFFLLALGLLDARFAAAATVFWLWRLATADLSEVVAAVGDVSLTAQVTRWMLMLAGLAIAARVTRASIRRAASL